MAFGKSSRVPLDRCVNGVILTAVGEGVKLGPGNSGPAGRLAGTALCRSTNWPFSRVEGSDFLQATRCTEVGMDLLLICGRGLQLES